MNFFFVYSATMSLISLLLNICRAKAGDFMVVGGVFAVTGDIVVTGLSDCSGSTCPSTGTKVPTFDIAVKKMCDLAKPTTTTPTPTKIGWTHFHNLLRLLPRAFFSVLFSFGAYCILLLGLCRALFLTLFARLCPLMLRIAVQGTESFRVESTR